MMDDEIDVDELIERRMNGGSLVDESKKDLMLTTTTGTSTETIGSSYRNICKDVEGKTMGSSELVIEWSDVKCTYPGKGGGEAKTTLHNASGSLKTRELTAIMGHSGSGKSTMLDILSGRKTTGTVTGNIKIFGQEVNNMKQASKLLRDVTAFVPQDVMFFPMQTPEEAVQFVARLTHRNKEDASLEKCHSILRDVGLTNPELYSRPIGGELAGGLSIRGLSGGEQKRLALACALAMDPQLIMLDEITSGLDSENALATILLLKKVCITRNVSAAIIIHQPDGYIFQEFDRLVLLAKGACVFSDDISYLGQLYSNQLKAPMPDSPHEVPLDLMRKLGRLDAQALSVSFRRSDSAVIDGTESKIFAKQKVIEEVPFYAKLPVVLNRNLVNHYIRNLTNLVARLFTYTACSAIGGAMFWNVGETQRNQALVGALTFTLNFSYLLPFTTLPVFVHEKKFFVVERSLGLYSPWIYCISQAVLEMCVVIMAAFLEAAVIIPMVGLWNPAKSNTESFFTILCALVVSGLTGSSLVQMFAILMPSQDLAFLIAAGMTTVWIGISGGFVPLNAIEDWISWLQWFSACKYSLGALSMAVFEGSEEEALLDELGLDRPGTVAGNLGVLLLFYLFFAIGSMIALSQQKHRR